jgi:peptide/nickel transport system ATP-binding protein
MLLAGSTRKLIEIKDLKVYFIKGGLLSRRSITKAVDGVDLIINEGEIMGLVGESGSGKTTLGKASIGLIKPYNGEVLFHLDSNNIINISKARGKNWINLRRYLQIIYQDPYSSIDPYMRVYDSLRLPLKYMGIKSKDEIDERIKKSMELVGLPLELLSNYVFQLSGGQRQRLSIARAILLEPRYIVADEPVTMLDVSLKGEILDVILRLKRDKNISFLFITHEIPVARVVADKIAIMYLGKIVEISSTEEILNNPLHPYTQALIDAYPKVRPEERFKPIPIKLREEVGQSSSDRGCRFYPRCPFAMEKCRVEEPRLVEVKPGHLVACWLY